MQDKTPNVALTHVPRKQGLARTPRPAQQRLWNGGLNRAKRGQVQSVSRIWPESTRIEAGV